MAKVQEKAWYKSKTFIGVIISVIGKVGFLAFGYEAADTDVAVVTDIAVSVVNADSVVAALSLVASFFGDLFAVYGRVKATKKITK